ncbi:MAG TPA: hypothetical protein PLP01_02935 [Phycisphaerae bacterium]|nr:hypothetical protein [Phycisphaerae bacterium]
MPADTATTPTVSEAARLARWRLCLHEAGHAVAGRVLLGNTARAVVFDDGCGAAYMGNDRTGTDGFERVLAIAAGPAAESLADRYTPPESAPAPALEATYPELAAELKRDLGQWPSDEQRIARWCIAWIEDQPERWVNRFHWIHHEARLLVAAHEGQIVQTAAVLYGRGIVTLPADTGEKGIEHVD